MTRATITGWGMAVPPTVLTNADLERFTETSDEWITTRSGIKERRISHVPMSDLSAVAGARALAAAGALTVADTARLLRARGEAMQAVLWGHGRVIALEHAHLFGGLIDTDDRVPGGAPRRAEAFAPAGAPGARPAGNDNTRPPTPHR